jgi:hypothetical protein
MDPISCPLITIAVAYAAGRVLKILLKDETQRSHDTRDEVRRLSDATINTMRQTSSEFRDHINRETHSYRR